MGQREGDTGDVSLSIARGIIRPIFSGGVEDLTGAQQRDLHKALPAQILCMRGLQSVRFEHRGDGAAAEQGHGGEHLLERSTSGLEPPQISRTLGRSTEGGASGPGSDVARSP